VVGNHPRNEIGFARQNAWRRRDAELETSFRAIVADARCDVWLQWISGS